MIYRLLFACLVSLSSASSALAQATATPPHEPVAERPLRFEAAIAAFEARDRVDPPPKHAVLLSGASYMLRWTNAAAALAPGLEHRMAHELLTADGGVRRSWLGPDYVALNVDKIVDVVAGRAAARWLRDAPT